MENEIKQLKAYPDPAIQKIGETIEDLVARRKRILQLVQEALQQLRLDMKYLMFDLECTRRERDEYKEMTEGVPMLPNIQKGEAKRILQHVLEHGSRSFTQLQVLGACEALK